MKRKAIVIDIDNCVLDTQFILEEIHKLGLKGEEKWEYFYKNCNSDRVEVIEETKKFLDIIQWCVFKNKNEIYSIDTLEKAKKEMFTIIISTARNEKCFIEIKHKLENEGFYPHYYLMRKDGDLRPASEVKKDHLIEIMKDYDIIAFIDDDIDNCEMAKSLGVLSLRRV